MCVRSLVFVSFIGTVAATSATTVAALQEEINKLKDVCRVTEHNCRHLNSGTCLGPGTSPATTVSELTAFVSNVRKQPLLSEENCCLAFHHHPHACGKCRCTGNQGKAAQQAPPPYYPITMGNFCKAWDDPMNYCQPGGSSAGAAWCDDPWCYTDGACPGSSPGSYFSGQEGPQLYYNYRVCDATDVYTATIG